MGIGDLGIGDWGFGVGGFGGEPPNHKHQPPTTNPKK